ncbi:[protein release factor]-glutamine N5-methyltransferase [Devosia sp. YR412]|nr:peptide chain release factor N(5)-glutamine methyltransferase [Devosia sp. YR412]SEQ31305.1 [protein release factor]-glutamine N5-methyltransferase [Devosia sp. YR412]
MLTRLDFASAAPDAKLLTGHALGLSTLDLATRENDLVDEPATARVAELIRRRMTGESVARIIGFRAFYGLDFILNEATLEPRPDTELLVDLALGHLPAGGRLLDLGTGTGCIPIAILANQSDASAVAVDLSARALEAAHDNAERNGVSGRMAFPHGSWFDPLDEDRFDLITSNPPYITSAVVETLAPEVKDFDPRLALDGGPDGLAPYRVIATQAADWLKPGGWVLVEIGYDQGAAVSALFLEAGFEDVNVHRDLNQLDRVVAAHHI